MFKQSLACAIALTAHAMVAASPYEDWAAVVRSAEFRTNAGGHAEGGYGDVVLMQGEVQPDGSVLHTTYFGASSVDTENCQLLVAQSSPPMPMQQRAASHFTRFADQACGRRGHPLEVFTAMLLSRPFADRITSIGEKGYASLKLLIAQPPDPRTPALKTYLAFVTQRDLAQHADCASFSITMQSAPGDPAGWSVLAVSPLVPTGTSC
jgi:hypothetical protein